MSLFITLEGIEGVGKSSAMVCVQDWLSARGRLTLVTREPGGTALGEKIRAILLDPGLDTLTPMSELLLVFAARAQHLETCIRPALAAGRCVICDRFTDATYAYQGGGRGLAESMIAAMETIVHADLQPDLTLLLDAPAELALGRARARSDADRFERETVAFFERVRASYRARAERYPQRFVVIDAAPRIDQVHARIRAALSKRLP